MKSATRGSAVLTAAFSLLLIGAQPGSGLTIFRIGNTADEICAQPNARCFEWFDVTDADNFGLAQGVASPNGFLQPEALDVNDDIAPIVRDRQHGWLKSSNGYGWQDEGRADGTGLDWLIDGDVTTAYTGIGNPAGNPGCGNASGTIGVTEPGSCKGIWFKLGGLFPIDRVVFHTTPENKNERFVPNFVIGANDARVERELTQMGNNSNLREREGYMEWRSGVFVDFDFVHSMMTLAGFHRDYVLEVELPDDKSLDEIKADLARGREHLLPELGLAKKKKKAKKAKKKE